MPVYITRQDKPGRGEQWVLNIGHSVATLIKPDGQPLLEWTPAQIEQGVEFPSFSKSIKYVGFAILCRGIYGFYHYSQLKKLAGSQRTTV